MNSVMPFVVTGGSLGLGLAIAEEAFRQGFPVALIARDQQRLEDARTKIMKRNEKSKQKVSIHSIDLVDNDMVLKVFSDIRDTHGGIRALINNAGTWMGHTVIKDLSRSEVQRSLNLNFFSAFNATKAALSFSFRSQDLSIVNIGATSSLQGWDNVAAFCIAKGALRSFSQSLARELGPQGIHVSHLIIDGIIDNDRTRGLNPNAEDENFIKTEAIAKSILHVALQEKSCWTFEWDIRPYNESW